jgi:hypothetical protein
MSIGIASIACLPSKKIHKKMLKSLNLAWRLEAATGTVE